MVRPASALDWRLPLGGKLARDGFKLKCGSDQRQIVSARLVRRKPCRHEEEHIPAREKMARDSQKVFKKSEQIRESVTADDVQSSPKSGPAFGTALSLALADPLC
jgi:hypothetical protein